MTTLQDSPMMRIRTALETIHDRVSSRRLTHHPWKIEREGQLWAMTTDGYRMLLIAGDSEWEPWPPTEILPEKVINSLFAPLEHETVIPFADLLAFSHSDVKVAACPRCGKNCTWCKEQSNIAYGWFKGVCVNRLLLGDVLPLLDAETVVVGLTQYPTHPCFHVRASSWHFALMGMNMRRGPDSSDLELCSEIPSHDA